MAELIDKFAESPWLTRLMAIFAVGTFMNFAGLAVSLWLIGKQASRGQMARDVQELKYPVSVKLYEDAFRRGVITSAELECFRDARTCPPPKTP